MSSLISWITLGLGFFATILSGGRPSNFQQDATSGPINLTRVGFEQTRLETSVGEISVFEAGEGEPLLLLHGVGAGASSFIWYAIAPQLAEHYRVIAPDFVGWGESDRPARPILFDDYVAQIQDIGKWIGEPTKVVAQSLTSGFVVAAMEEHGVSFSSLVFHAPSGGLDFGLDAFRKGATQYFAAIAASPERDKVYGQLFHRKPAVEDWFRRVGFLDPEAAPEDLIEAGHYNAKQPNASYSALPFLSGQLRYDIAPYLRRVSVPAIMVWGEEEVQINEEIRTRIEGVNPDIDVIKIQHARSTFEVERPEETLDVLLPFLREAQ